MTSTIIVSGTDTGIGKTVVSAMLTLALDGVYWKPVQSGLEDETDRDAVQRITGLPGDRFPEEAYRLRTPASPHVSAEIDGVEIDLAALSLPQTDRPLIVEGAGGLLVPLTRQVLYIDRFKVWDAPVVLCARTGLGTINHTLLSIEALHQREVPLLGIIFVGEAVPDSERTICDFSGAKRLGRLPVLREITARTLGETFAEGFDAADFIG